MKNIQIIPAINAEEMKEIQDKLSLLEKAGIGWAQIDVADGIFTGNTLWHNPTDLISLNTSLKLEIHLMINEPEQRVGDWLAHASPFGNGDRGLQRIIFHVSSSKDPDFVINRCHDYGKDVGIAIGPDESVVAALAYKDKVNMFQILSVRPGLPGQKMLDGTVEKIKEIRKACPSHLIEVDGGVNLENAKSLVDAGANILVSAKAVFGEGEASTEIIKENVSKLRKIATN